jgi:hypothetical protein
MSSCDNELYLRKHYCFNTPRNVTPKPKEITMSTVFDPKPGQHKLRDVLKSIPKQKEILDFFRETLSVTTAEELISYITAGLKRPESITQEMWLEINRLAEAALPKKVLRQCKTRPKFTPPLGARV